MGVIWLLFKKLLNSVGNIASKPYTNENGVLPVAQLGVIRKAHKTNGNSITHFPA
jgi:hypothetical protein